MTQRVEFTKHEQSTSSMATTIPPIYLPIQLLESDSGYHMATKIPMCCVDVQHAHKLCVNCTLDCSASLGISLAEPSGSVVIYSFDLCLELWPDIVMRIMRSGSSNNPPAGPPGLTQGVCVPDRPGCLCTRPPRVSVYQTAQGVCVLDRPGCSACVQ